MIVGQVIVLAMVEVDGGIIIVHIYTQTATTTNMA